jgi:hypothetical protein
MSTAPSAVAWVEVEQTTNQLKVALTAFCIRLAANSGSSPNTADDLRQMSTEQCNDQWDAFTAPVNVLLENV